MKFPAVILMGLTFATLVFFFMFIPDVRNLRVTKADEICSFDDAPILDVKTRNDSFRVHFSPPSQQTQSPL